MLEDSPTFQLSSLAPLKGEKHENLDARKKDRLAKCQSITLIVLIFKSSMYVIKTVKNKTSKTKTVVYFVYSLFTLIFHFQHIHFKNKIFSRIANIYDGYRHKLTKRLFKK